MRCEEIALLLPEAIEHASPAGGRFGAVLDESAQLHVERCIRCQAELARYRRMLRGLQLLRTQYLEPAPGLLAQTLAAVTAATERSAVRRILSGRRAVYAGALGGGLAAAAAGATTAVVLVHRARRRTAALAH
jgi:hypothetical protein